MSNILILFYFLVILAIGLFVKDTKKSNFLYSGRKLTIPAFVATLVSTWYGAILEVGRFSYHNGVSTWLIFSLFYYLAAIGFAKYISKQINQSDAPSIPERFSKYYNKKAGVLAAIIIFFLVTPAPYIKMLADMLSYLWGINIFVCLIIGTTFSVLYTLRGGFASVIRTDIIQFILMFFGFGAMLAYLYSSYGGYSFLSSNLSSDMLSIPGKLNWGYILVWGFIALITFIDPGFYQRTYSGKDPNVVKKGIYISVVFWFIFDFMSISIGLYSAALLPEIIHSPYLDLADLILPPLFKAMFIVSLLSVIMSTIDSFIFISGYTFGVNILSEYISSKKLDSVGLTKVGIAVSGLFSVILATFFNFAVDIWYTMGSFAVPALLIPLLATYFKIEIKNIVTVMYIPLFTTGLWFLFGYMNSAGQGWVAYPLDIDPMYPGLLMSLILYFIFKSRCN